MSDEAHPLETLWAVLYRPTPSDPCRFLEFVLHKCLSSDDIDSVLDTVFDERANDIPDPLEYKNKYDFSWEFYKVSTMLWPRLVHVLTTVNRQLPYPHRPAKETAKAYEDKINNDNYFDDNCNLLHGTFSFAHIHSEHLWHLVLILSA